MISWWATLTVMMKILWGITLAASLIFIIQTVMTFIGADVDSSLDMDASGVDDPSAMDAGHSGMNLYTFRNLVNFILGFGWTAILLKDSITSTFLLIVISALVGVALVVLVMLLFKWLNSMQQTGTIDVFKQAAGCQGKVYLTIPAERKGTGKVQITINNSVREYDAVTDGDALPTGTDVKVVEAINESTLLVEPLNSLII